MKVEQISGEILNDIKAAVKMGLDYRDSSILSNQSREYIDYHEKIIDELDINEPIIDAAFYKNKPWDCRKITTFKRVDYDKQLLYEYFFKNKTLRQISLEQKERYRGASKQAMNKRVKRNIKYLAISIAPPQRPQK